MKKRLSVRAGKIATAAVVAGSFFMFAAGASAAALTGAQINSILSLLQSFGVDQTTIGNVQGVLNGTGSSTPVFQSKPSIVFPGASASSTCATISGPIGPGSHGKEVEQLQAFLAKNPSIYPQGAVTGFYGKMTEDAVARWQAAQSIVSTGTPLTTGYGVVGPHTKDAMDHEMEMECESGDQGSALGGEGADHASATSTWAHSESESHASATSTWAHANQGDHGGELHQTVSSSSSSSQDN